MTATAVTKVSALKEQLDRLTPSYAKLLPKNYPVDRLVTGALVAVTTNPALAKCKPLSIATALAKVAQWGLDVGDTAHLVPFGDTCTAVADFKGLVKLMKEAGARKVESREVREGDRFHYSLGTDPRLEHQPSSDRSKPIIAAYAVVWHKSGDVQFEVMTAEEIDGLRQQYSKQWKAGPLTAWYARKTLIRRVAKYVPRTPALALALADEPFDPETGEILADGPSLPPDLAADFEPGDAHEDDAA